MDTSLPSPLATPASSSSNPLVAQPTSHPPSISSQIDALLESYLSLLDTYTSLRATLSKELSSGFFALAQAQRSSTLGSGRRYGEDCYDQRMKASRALSIEPDGGQEEGGKENDGDRQNENEKDNLLIEIRPLEQASTSQPTKDAEGPVLIPNTNDTSPSAGKTPESPASQAPSGTSKSNPRSLDPLRWFGILTPPALRQCQASFVSAVQGSIPVLINTSNKMLVLEREIENLRSQLNESIPTPSDQSAAQDEGREETLQQSSASMKSPSKTKSKSKTVLPSRPTEPRSRILKID